LDVKINTATYTATVTFAPEKTNIERLIKALEKERFVVSGSRKLLE
jgi:copper chaperone CopZ